MGVFDYLVNNQSEVITDLQQHIVLSGEALILALLLALVLGTIIAQVRALTTPLIGILGAIYTVPSLALLAFLVPFVGTGSEPAIIALVAYAQFILVRNVVVGLTEVDPSVIDAARGMGMSRLQILFKIEYPLALPVILAGLRIATVATIAIATVAAWIDAGGLGEMLFNGIAEDNQNQIVVGAIAVSLLAILADVLLRLVDRTLPATRAGVGR